MQMLNLYKSAPLVNPQGLAFVTLKTVIAHGESSQDPGNNNLPNHSPEMVSEIQAFAELKNFMRAAKGKAFADEIPGGRGVERDHVSLEGLAPSALFDFSCDAPMLILENTPA